MVALVGLYLGLVGGVTVACKDDHLTVAQAQSNEAEYAAPKAENTYVFDKPMPVEDLKKAVLDNAEYIGKKYWLEIKNQTSLSGHLSEVLKPLFVKISQSHLSSKQLIELILTNDDLNSQDFRELMQLIGDTPEPFTVVNVTVDRNHIADFSSANLVGLTHGGLPLVSGWEEETDPAVNSQLPSLFVNNQQQVLIPLKAVSKFGAEKISSPITRISNANFPEIIEMQGDVAPDNPDSVFDEASGRYKPLNLDYAKPGDIFIPDVSKIRASIDYYEENREKPEVIKDLKEKGFTVNSYIDYLNQQIEGNVTVDHVEPDAKKLRLRLGAYSNSGMGMAPVLEFSLSSASSTSSSATPSSTGSPKKSEVSTPVGQRQVTSLKDSTPERSSNSSNMTQEVVQPDKGYPVAKMGQAVYSLKKIHLYRDATFSKAQRVTAYAKKPRINRPMFVVTDYLYSNSGRLRYKVRDVNHHSVTAGKKGYITANWQYVRPVYYTTKHSTLTVINPTGVNEYQNKNLTGKVGNFKQGTRVKVTGFGKHHLTTRYRLTNGHYITGNRKLVTAGKQRSVKQIKTKRTTYLYHHSNFNKRVKKVKSGTILKVKKWLYTHPYSTTAFGTKQYQVSGGYVMANKNFVKVIK